MRKIGGNVLLLLIGIVLVTTSCAVNQKYTLTQAAPDFKISGTDILAVAVQDQREYVISQKNKPQLCGIIRGGWGNPFYITTTSGRPLAEDMCEALSNSLNKKGYQATCINIAPDCAYNDVLKKLTEKGAKRAVFLSLKEWQPDRSAWENLGLNYDFKLQVVNSSGNVTAEKFLSGHDNLGKSKGGFKALKVYEKNVSDAFEKKLEEMFNSPDIIKAMKK